LDPGGHGGNPPKSLEKGDGYVTYVYDFQHGSGSAKDLLGGKGAGLAEMTRLGLPVPPGFTVTTSACRAYLEANEFPTGMWDEVSEAVARLETRSGRHFGEPIGDPLLVSVRSGAKFSMPGMMDTVLNLGINDEIHGRLTAWSGDDRFAWDAYRRFIQTYGKVVLSVPGDLFESVLTELRESAGVDDDSQLTAGQLEEAAKRFRGIVEDHAGTVIPDDPVEQLHLAVSAVFSSWNNRRAQSYRRLHGISDDLGTAANVQMMVFGDLDDDSGTGVCFTRDPATGERAAYGDYLPNAQGEDVVAGIRNTLTLDELANRHPANHAQLLKVMATLERDYRDMCDIEFTIEREKLWILQTRVGKRTAQAAVRVATEMVEENLIDRSDAVLRVDPASLDQLLHPYLPSDIEATPLATGIAASPGAAVGQAVFDADRAEALKAEGKDVLLVRWETTPDDIHGMIAATGILTSHGGKTSHAAVVARGMGTPAVTGTAMIDVDVQERCFTVDDTRVSEGDWITIDGTTGRVFSGRLELHEPTPSPELKRLLGWADRYRRLGVRANADTPADAAVARGWGAEGIGLARTEHMFLGDRLPVIRQVILAEDETERKTALEKLRQLQASDFAGILEAMDGLVVVVRLLDPPLHEFLPDRWDLERERVEKLLAGEDVAAIEKAMEQVAQWEETNPMLGLRGVRLGLLMPDIYGMQVQAALEAVVQRVEAGGKPRLEIMVPLVATSEELHQARVLINAEIEEAEKRAQRALEVRVGTMIETPRGALRATAIAREADFFSFGTNDLTQMTYGFSRDDAETNFLATYLEEGVMAVSPFETVDAAGVGRLVELATSEGKAANPRLEVGVCGEHGGDPDSIVFFHHAGVDYVSCSPPRVPAARLAAAQAALGETSHDASA
jgi:pyruvate,orthophosphate dikinase